MGSVSDMGRTNLAVTILEELGGGNPFEELKGQTVEILEVGIEGQISSIYGWVRVRTPGGKLLTIDIGTTHEITDSGVAGYGLENVYDEDELREAMQRILASDGLSDSERRDLQADLDSLHDYYES